MQKKTGALIVAIAAACWSGSGVLGKFTTWSPIATAGSRALLAVFFMGIMRRGFRVRVTRGNLLGALGVSVTSVLYIISNKLTTSANAIVLQYAMPAFVILLLWVLFHQKPARRDIVTVCFVLAGVFLCSLDGVGGGSTLGNALALLSGFTYSFVFLCSRMKDANAEEYTYLGLILCTPLTLFAFFDKGATFTLPNILAQIGLGLCLSTGYFLIARGMKYVSPMTAAITSNIEPVLNPIWVFLFLGERPGAIAILGAVVVLATVTIYSLPARAKQSPGSSTLKERLP